MQVKRRIAAIAVCAIALSWSVRAQDLASFEKRTTVKVLPNGLTLIVCERPEAPVFSFYTLVDAGSARRSRRRQRPRPHVRAHGLQGHRPRSAPPTTPPKKLALAKVETAYAAYDAEYRKRVGQDPAKLASSSKHFQDAAGRSAEVRHPQPVLRRSPKQNGAVGLNASTDGRLHPVLLEHALQPPRTLGLPRKPAASAIPSSASSTRSATSSRKSAACASTPTPSAAWSSSSSPAAYVAHPYGRPGVGWESEISQVTATEAAAFHKKYYVPANIVIAVVGDVKASDDHAHPREATSAPSPPAPSPSR